MPRNTTPKVEPELTIADAASLVRVSTKTVRRWIAEGRLPAQRYGPRLIRIRLGDLEAMGRRIPAARSVRHGRSPVGRAGS